MLHSVRWSGLALAMSASVALAQDAVKPPITVRKAPQVQREVQKVPEAVPTNQQGEDARTSRASDMLGTDLVLENGETLGQVSDLIIDNRNGQVAYVIVETEQDFRPIPWKTLALYQGEQANDRYFIIGMERERFMQSPAIQRTEWQTYSTPQGRTHWNTFQPRVGQFYADVRVSAPRSVRAAVDRKVDQGERKADRKIDQSERKIDRKID